MATKTNRIKLTALIIGAGILSACGGSGSEDSTNEAPKPTTQAPVKQAEASPKTPEQLGEKVFKRCVTCHTVEENGRHRVGPNLWGVFGKTSGTDDGFAFSKAMKDAAVVWDEETISAYVENPRKYMPGNKMAYVGLKKQQDRENLIAYLKESTGAN